MFPDNLSGAVALDSRCSLVPARDVTAQVEGKNGVVFHAFNQQPKSLGTLLKPPLGRLLRGDVPVDLQNAQGPAFIVAPENPAAGHYDFDAIPTRVYQFTFPPTFVKECTLGLFNGYRKLGVQERMGNLAD